MTHLSATIKICKPIQELLTYRAMFTLQNVSKTYLNQQRPALASLSLDITTGETLVLLGSSGCGKTTLLKLLNRLNEPDTGHITFNGKNIKSHSLSTLRHSIGYVFQRIGLFPHMTIERNISICLELMGQSKQHCRHRAHELLTLIHLDPNKYAKRYPDELSGGQQQRVGVARALAADPQCLLMDEPFGALDAITRDALQQELIELKAQLQKTIVFVTHDIKEALRLADRIMIMHAGKIEQLDTPNNIINAPASTFVESLMQNHSDTMS